jgi:hypothetical protein
MPARTGAICSRRWGWSLLNVSLKWSSPSSMSTLVD